VKAAAGLAGLDPAEFGGYSLRCRATIKVRTPDNQDEKNVPPVVAQGGRSPTGGATGGKIGLTSLRGRRVW
jgi:hypothetical protein